MNDQPVLRLTPPDARDSLDPLLIAIAPAPALSGVLADHSDRPRVQVSRAIEPVVDVVWGQPVAGERAYEPWERTPREALALRLFVFLAERDARLAAERGDHFSAQADIAVGSAAA